MKLDVFIYKEGKLKLLGEVTILKDRIANINFKRTSCRKANNKKTAYPFSLQKLSKADLPYREFNLTDELVCSSIKTLGYQNLHIKITKSQRLTLTYFNKGFIWQTKEFKKKIYDSIGIYVALAIAGLLGTLLFSTLFIIKPVDKTKTTNNTTYRENRDTGSHHLLNRNP